MKLLFSFYVILALDITVITPIKRAAQKPYFCFMFHWAISENEPRAVCTH